MDRYASRSILPNPISLCLCIYSVGINLRAKIRAVARIALLLFLHRGNATLRLPVQFVFRVATKKRLGTIFINVVLLDTAAFINDDFSVRLILSR